MSIQMSEFAKRQYSSTYSGTRVTVTMVEELINLAENPIKEFAGYADFCKIIVISNRQENNGDFIFSDLKVLTVNRESAFKMGGKLLTAYEARNENELPVLVEWVSGLEAPTAEYIHLILYNAAQMAKEKEPITADWAIVAISTSSTIEVEPMRPITMMRNALGVSEGGSGVPLDRVAYDKSVAFWRENIMIRQ